MTYSVKYSVHSLSHAIVYLAYAMVHLAYTMVRNGNWKQHTRMHTEENPCSFKEGGAGLSTIFFIFLSKIHYKHHKCTNFKAYEAVMISAAPTEVHPNVLGSWHFFPQVGDDVYFCDLWCLPLGGFLSVQLSCRVCFLTSCI